MNRTATLILGHSLIDTDGDQVSASSTVGSWSDDKAITIFRDIDLRALMGADMWDSSDTFGLRLAQVAVMTSTGWPFDPEIDPMAICQLSGLNWMGCNYDVQTATNGRWANLYLANITSAGEVMTFHPSQNVLYFRKSEQRVTLTFKLVIQYDPTILVQSALDDFIPSHQWKLEFFPVC